MSIKFLVLGEGGILGFFWGGADFIFMGAKIFLKKLKYIKIGNFKPENTPILDMVTDLSNLIKNCITN